MHTFMLAGNMPKTRQRYLSMSCNYKNHESVKKSDKQLFTHKVAHKLQTSY